MKTIPSLRFLQFDCFVAQCGSCRPQRKLDGTFVTLRLLHALNPVSAAEAVRQTRSDWHYNIFVEIHDNCENLAIKYTGLIVGFAIVSRSKFAKREKICIWNIVADSCLKAAAA